MNKTLNNRAWFMVLPVLLLVAFSAVIPLMTVVNYSVQDTFGNNEFSWYGIGWYAAPGADHGAGLAQRGQDIPGAGRAAAQVGQVVPAISVMVPPTSRPAGRRRSRPVHRVVSGSVTADHRARGHSSGRLRVWRHSSASPAGATSARR